MKIQTSSGSVVFYPYTDIHLPSLGVWMVVFDPAVVPGCPLQTTMTAGGVKLLIETIILHSFVGTITVG